jgi:hypothetical protein
MKYIVTESQYKRLNEDRTIQKITDYKKEDDPKIIEWLDGKFGNLRIVKGSSFPGSVFFVNEDGDIIFEFKTKPEKLIVSQRYVCGYLYNIFGMLESDRNRFIRQWFYNSYGFKPKLGFVDCSPFNTYGKIKFK